MKAPPAWARSPRRVWSGYSVSNLRIPASSSPGQPWEQSVGKPDRIVSSLDIMLEGPLGAAAFNNEFGRPCIAGYFRAFEQPLDGATRAVTTSPS